MKFTSEWIAPWALPNERFPFFLTWDGTNIDRIVFRLPGDFLVEDLFNVEEFREGDHTITIEGLKTPDYFGALVFYSGIPEGIRHQGTLSIEFYGRDELLGTKNIEANILRPRLSLLNSPNEIVLKRGTRMDRLFDVGLKYEGVGEVILEIRGRTGGRVLTRTSELALEVLRQIIEKHFLSPEEEAELIEENDTRSELDIRISEDELDELAQNIEDLWLKGRLSLKVFEDLKDIPPDELRKSISLDALRKFTAPTYEGLIVDSLLYYMEKTPAKRIELDGGRSTVLFEPSVDFVELEIRYRDKVGNEYQSVLVPRIHVKDLRTTKDKEERFLGAPVNLKFEFEQGGDSC